jgi:hypothetical protein
LIAWLLAGSFTVHGESTPEKGLDGITKPVSDIEISFVQQGKVRQITVKEGGAQLDSEMCPGGVIC